MTKDTNRKTTQHTASGFGDHEGGGANRRERASYPEPERKTVIKKEYVSAYNQETDDLLQGDPLEESSMALSVTRHASTPPVAQSQLILFGYTGRESSKPTNSLPEKDKEYQHYLGVGGSGRECGQGCPPSILVSISEKSSKTENSKSEWVPHDYQVSVISYPAKVKISIHTPVGVGRLTDSPTNAYYEKITQREQPSLLV